MDDSFLPVLPPAKTLIFRFPVPHSPTSFRLTLEVSASLQSLTLHLRAFQTDRIVFPADTSNILPDLRLSFPQRLENFDILQYEPVVQALYMLRPLSVLKHLQLPSDLYRSFHLSSFPKLSHPQIAPDPLSILMPVSLTFRFSLDTEFPRYPEGGRSLIHEPHVLVSF